MKILSCLCLIFILSSCSKSSSQIAPILDTRVFQFPATDIADLHIYIKNSNQAKVLKHCILISNSDQACSLETLPLLGMAVDQPIIDDVMQRVVVSHDWMGKRFQEVLSKMPRETLTLLKATTAIVIAKNIRPSYFSGITGAIYLDPAFLWLSNGEKTLVGKNKDYRADFIKPLQFNLTYRDLVNNNWAYPSYSLTGTEVRTIDNILIPISHLLFHELGHANDCVKTNNMANISAQQSYYDLYVSQIDKHACTSQLLKDRFPLSSNVWMSLGKVLYQGVAATAEQIAMTAREVGLAFNDDIAISFYSFSNAREATADAFDVLMLKKYFNVDRDLAVLQNHKSNTCGELIVAWGQRNRLAVPQVYERSLFVAKRFLPSVDFSALQSSLPAPSDIPQGSSRCTLVYSQNSLSSQSVESTYDQTKLSKPNVIPRHNPIDFL